MKASKRQPGTIISSFKKDNELVEICKKIKKHGYEIFASGGTYKYLSENGVEAKDLTEITNIHDVQDGRVKTLSPIIYEAILRKGPLKNDNPLKSIEMVYVDLYPFPEFGNFDENIELIDIGGITLLRAAAKNSKYVVPFIDANDISNYLDNGDVKFRKKMAKKVFSFTSFYDSIIARSIDIEDESDKRTFPVHDKISLRYGENPQDLGNIYKVGDSGLLDFEIFTNKKGLGFNNYYDTYIAMAAISKSKGPACSVVKHGNPIGVCEAVNIETAFENAIKTDELSSFGGIFCFNRPLSNEFLMKLSERFFEVLILPELDEEMVPKIFEKRKNLRIMVGDIKNVDFTRSFRGFDNMILENVIVDDKINIDIKVQCKAEDKERYGGDMVFGLNIIRTYTSNSMILVKNKNVVGAGFGMPNRVEALKRAIEQAGENAKDSVLISDGFLPFTDSVDLAAEAGIALLLQPGGSLADKKVIKRAIELGIGMVFTGKRYFRH